MVELLQVGDRVTLGDGQILLMTCKSDISDMEVTLKTIKEAKIVRIERIGEHGWYDVSRELITTDELNLLKQYQDLMKIKIERIQKRTIDGVVVLSLFIFPEDSKGGINNLSIDLPINVSTSFTGLDENINYHLKDLGLQEREEDEPVG